MKHILIFLLAAAVLLGMAGCSSAEDHALTENYSFTYDGTKITLGAEAAAIVRSLGDPTSYTEETSCAFDGLDKTYYYGSFYLSTYPENGKDYVYRIWFVDDTVATEEGIRIGSTKEQAEAIFGAGCFQNANVYTMSRGKSSCSILVEDGVVSSIQYFLDSE